VHALTKILRESSDGNQWWLRIEEFVAHQPRRVSHGLCPGLARHCSGPNRREFDYNDARISNSGGKSLAMPKASLVSWEELAIHECRPKNGEAPDVKRSAV
jgi:hypothetical protein